MLSLQLKRISWHLYLLLPFRFYPVSVLIAGERKNSLTGRTVVFLSTLKTVQIPICGGKRSSSPPAQAVLWIPAGCSTIHLNSDTIYLERATDLTGEGFSPMEQALPLQMLDARSGSYLCFWPTRYKLEVPTTPPTQMLLQVQAATCTSAPLAVNQRFQPHPPWVWYIC